MYNNASIYKGGGVYNMGEASALPDNYEKPKRYAVVGDAVYADANGNTHFLVASTINPSTLPSGWEFVGVVALREGEKATILYKTENTSVKWASMWIFKVNGLKLDGTDSFVLQQGPTSGSTPVEIGTFTATESATDLDTLVSELDTWLRANTTAEGALADYNWHAEKHADKDGVDACFILVDNINYQSRFTPIKSSTSGATAPLYMWNWSGFDTDFTTIIRKDGVNTTNVLWSKERFKAYDTNIGTTTDSLTSTGLMNEATFNASTVVKGYYGTYDNYLDNMLPDENAASGPFYSYSGKGKLVAESTKDIVFPNLSGTDTSVFTAEAWAGALKGHSTASVEGFSAGDFYIPGIDEEFKIFSAMKIDGSDQINATIVKAGGSKFPVDGTRIRTVPARSGGYGASTTWLLASTGAFSYSGHMAIAYCACAVAEIDL